MSRKGGTGGGGQVYPKGENSMAIKALVWSQEGNFSCIMDLTEETKNSPLTFPARVG